MLSIQLPTLKISSFRWSSRHKPGHLQTPCRAHAELPDGSLEAVAVVSPTECQGKLWREGQYPRGGQRSRSSTGRRQENRERKGSNYQSHFWKPFLLPEVKGRTKATTPFLPTFRSGGLKKKRGWWLL